MKRLLLLFLLPALLLQACSPDGRKVTEGRVTYAIDYPNHKDNFFLYSILPKEMQLNFKDGRMQSLIKKANLSNSLLVDCNKKDVSAYFSYGTEAFNVTLSDRDVRQMIAEQEKYSIRLVNETDTLAGFRVKKAIATAVKDPSDKITLWYTDEIRVKNSNWYNPFRKVPGFLLAYSIDRYGIRMDFRAKSFEEIEVTEEMLAPPKHGTTIPYRKYNEKLGELFQSFDKL